MPRAVKPSAISSPTYPAPMMIAVWVPLDQMPVQREGVAHRVHHVDAIVGAEAVEAGDAGVSGSAPVPTISSS